METNHANSSGIGGTDASSATTNLPEATPDQASGATASATSTGASTAGATAAGGSQSSGNTNAGDGKNWMEFANLQKIVDQLPQGVRDFCTNSWSQVNTQVGKMSTTQKVAGAVALVGLGYLALRPGKSKSHKNKKHRGSWDNTYRGSSYGSATGARSGSSYGHQDQSRSGAGYGSGSGVGYGSGSASSSGADFGSGAGSDFGSGSSSASGSSSSGSAGDATYRGNLGGSSSTGLDYSGGI